jgi:hypothetical protein
MKISKLIHNSYFNAVFNIFFAFYNALLFHYLPYTSLHIFGGLLHFVYACYYYRKIHKERFKFDFLSESADNTRQL